MHLFRSHCQNIAVVRSVRAAKVLLEFAAQPRRW